MLFRSAVLICFSVFLVSCTSMNSFEKDRIVSENTVLKRKMELLERENGVIRRENTDTAAALKGSEATLEKTRSDLAAFKKKYETDTVLLNNKYDNLKKSNDLQQKQNAERIKLLTDQNALLEKDLADKVKALAEENRKNTEQFNADREKMKKDAAKRESEFTKIIESQKSANEAKDRQINDLNETIRKINEQLNEAARAHKTDASAVETKKDDKK
jgi:hypothetical protein